MGFDINFSNEKSQLLKSTRGISFEEIIDLIQDDTILGNKTHPNKNRPNQRIYLIKIKNYVYVVPYVINYEKEEIFLKTIYPSSKYTNLYKKGDKL